MTRAVVVMSMGGVGHVQVLLPVIGELRSRGTEVHVFTATEFRAAVEATGAGFIDLFADHPLDAVDATSRPIPSRNVTFAAVYAEKLARLVAPLSPAVIIYDTFTVVAPVVARLLGVAHVNVCPNHALVAHRALADLQDDPRVAISEACWKAVTRLRDVHGLKDASPFSYLTGISPHLNLYAEPAEFLDPEDHSAFEPLAFFGCLGRPTPSAEPSALAPRQRPSRRLRIYVSFGTVVWWYFETAALAALATITEVLADEDVDVLVSLGRHDLAPTARDALRRPNVRVEAFVDQRSVLEETDLFVTHHGINSTHEAIFRQAPMLSYPFFGDQPALARRCQDLGLALPLAAGPMQPIDPAGLRTAMERVKAEWEAFADRLAQARGWELRTMAARGPVIERILALETASRR